MSKPKIINRFEGGINESVRDNSTGSFNSSSYMENFEPRLSIGQLIPKPLIVKDSNYTTTDTATKFSESGSLVYALGNQKLLQLDSAFTGTPAWTTLVNGFDGGLDPATMEGGLLRYSSPVLGVNKVFLYWIYANRYVARWDIAAGSGTISGPAYVDLGSGLTITGALFIGKDDNIYFPYLDSSGTPSLGQLIGQTFTQVLTFPVNYQIIQIEKYGNYLAIAAQSNDVVNVSEVYLWDYVSQDVSEVIDCGQATLIGFGNVGNALMLISRTARFGAVFSQQEQLIIQIYDGGTPRVIKRFNPEALTFPKINIDQTANPSTGYSRPRVQNNSLYFGVTFNFDKYTASSTVRYGVMKIGKFKDGYEYAITIDARLGTETGPIGDALYVGDYLIYSTVPDTTHSSVFSHLASSYGTSTYETLIQSGSATENEKQDQYVSTSFLPLPNSAIVSLNSRKDADTAFNAVAQATTVGILYQKTNVDSSGVSLPKYFENTYQVISTGGAIITQLQYETIEYDSSMTP